MSFFVMLPFFITLLIGSSYSYFRRQHHPVVIFTFRSFILTIIEYGPTADYLLSSPFHRKWYPDTFQMCDLGALISPGGNERS